VTRDRRIAVIDQLLNDAAGLSPDIDGLEDRIFPPPRVSAILSALWQLSREWGIQRLEDATDDQIEEVERVVRSFLGGEDMNS